MYHCSPSQLIVKMSNFTHNIHCICKCSGNHSTVICTLPVHSHTTMYSEIHDLQMYMYTLMEWMTNLNEDSMWLNMSLYSI